MSEKSVKIKSKVTDRLKQAQIKKKFKDTEIVTYTRKYKLNYNIVTVNNLDELETDAINARKQVVKEKVWPAYDIQDQKEKGYSSGATYLKVQARKSLSKQPFDSRDARDIYVKNISKLQTILDGCMKAMDVYSALRDFISDSNFYMGKDSFLNYANSKKGASIFSKKFISFCYFDTPTAIKSLKEARQYEAFTKEQQDDYVEKALKEKNERLSAQKEELEEAKKKEFINDENAGQRFFKTMAIKIQMLEEAISDLINRKNLPEEKQVRRENWEWADKKSKKISLKPKAPRINTKKPLEHIVRTGGLEIPPVTTENIRKYFCFNNVVFGNALNDKESQENVKHFLGAITDMAEVLNIDICAINQLGKLDINFATMGVSGHMATYFSGYKAINLTRKKGDGSVAHEWFHYLDNVIEEGVSRTSSPVLASENSNSTSTGTKYAIHKLLEYIKKGDEIETETVIAKIPAQKKKEYIDFGDNLEESIRKIQNMYPVYKKSSGLNRPAVRDYYGFLAHKYGKKHIYVPLQLDTTRFFYNSTQIGSPYWYRNPELLARAWEVYIETLLEEKNMQNNYLVEYKQTFALMGDSMPFPVKETEKLRIKTLFDNVIKELKKEFEIPDFKPWTKKRQADFTENIQPAKDSKQKLLTFEDQAKKERNEFKKNAETEQKKAQPKEKAKPVKNESGNLPDENRIKEIIKQVEADRAEKKLSITELRELAKEIHNLRKKPGRKQDEKKTSKRRLALTPNNVLRWAMHPGRYDLIGVDARANASAKVVARFVKKAKVFSMFGIDLK